MNNNNVIKIGSVLKWRNVYDPLKKYYKENIVTAYGCVFRCKALSTQGTAPIEVYDTAGHLRVINSDVWDVILDNSEIYNQSLDERELMQEMLLLNTQLRNMRSLVNQELRVISAASTINVNALNNTDREYASLSVALNTLNSLISNNTIACTPGCFVIFKSEGNIWQLWQWQGGTWSDERDWKRYDESLVAIQIEDASELEELESHGQINPNALYYTSEE